ncbi:CBS domain-containing protein [Pseudochelatococcus contaminans]|uniref:CBS domain-containing protein n=1 Tax=Pseudochelatococcus contaminans TaxID=1538103 RepID=A0A7W5Z1W1_9HYPH|nr:CBS domain-containing protein [Pseudochelatococcus contaminans]MBB3808553.1 CBS domain-containing protein [Pseudochelatococcus contaminans]
MKARDILTSNVITVDVETPLPEVADLLVRHRVGSLPVLDGDGAVAGIVSEDDFLRRVETGTQRRLSRLAEFFTSDTALQEDYVRSRAQKAGDAMRTGLPHVTPDTELVEIVNVLENHNIHSVLVLEDGKLAGIISRSDLVRAFASSLHDNAQSAEDDRVIRKSLQDELAAQPWGRRFENSIVVVNGIVHLWGSVGSEAERAALRVAAERIPGVRGVEDHTIVRGLMPLRHKL